MKLHAAPSVHWPLNTSNIASAGWSSFVLFSASHKAPIVAICVEGVLACKIVEGSVTGEELQECLWYIDGHVTDNCHPIPSLFEGFTRYNTPKAFKALTVASPYQLLSGMPSKL